MRCPHSFRSFPARAVMAWAVSLLVLACGGDDLSAPETGGITVTTATSGTAPGAGGYVLTLDEGEPRPIGASAAVTLTALSLGEHFVRLAGVPDGCTLAGDNPRTVSVSAGDPIAVTFEITCPPAGGGVTITTSTVGPLQDPDGYTVQADDSPAMPIGANASADLGELSPGAHTLQLGGVAANCAVAGDNPRVVQVESAIPLSVEFMVACAGGALTWSPMNSGTSADLPDVWGTSATDVLVVGELETGSSGVASVILRYDGSNWTREFRGADLRLRGVWGSSATDAFAVGFHFFATGAALLHYDGTRWTEEPGFDDPFEDFAFNAVWGSSATDVFAVGEAFDGQFSRSLIFHYDGARWQRMPVVGRPAPALGDVWGSSPTDVYAVGVDQVNGPVGVIMRYDGAAWSPVLQEEGLLLNGIWGTSATDVFAVGFEVKQVGDEFRVTGTIRHYDGTGWSRVSLPPVGVLYEIWGSASTDVYAVGDDGFMLHYDGTAWTKSRPVKTALLGIWGSSAIDVFAVGNGGTILHGTP